MVKPVMFRALDSKGNIYQAVVETYINNGNFGVVDSNIPSNPKSMIELIDLRHKGFIIEDVKDGVLNA